MSVFISLIIVVLLIANALVCWRDQKSGFAMYLLLAIIAPNLSAGSLHLGYDIVAFPVLILVLALRMRRFTWTTSHTYLFLYLCLVLIMTAVFSADPTAETLWPALFGNVRLLIVMGLALALIDRRHARFILLAALFANTVLAVVQAFVPGSTTLMMALYFKPSMTPLAIYAHMGFFPRVVGSLGTPALVGLLAFLGYSICYSALWLRGFNFLDVCGVMAAVICGVLAGSKTAFIGIPLVTVMAPILFLMMGRKRTRRRSPANPAIIIVLLSILTAAGYGLLTAAVARGMVVESALTATTNPQFIFGARYDATRGNLSGTMDVVSEHPLFGVGSNSLQGEFLGDSAYTSTLHTAGAVGLILLLLIMLDAIRIGWRRKDVEGIILILALLLSSLGAPELLTGLSALVLAFVISESERSPSNTGKPFGSTIKCY